LNALSLHAAWVGLWGKLAPAAIGQWSPLQRVSGTLETVLHPANPAIQLLLAEYRRLLIEHLGERLISLTLFGSYARGEAGPESDVDVAVVLDRINTHSDRVLPMELAGGLIVEHGLVITPLVLSVSELEFLHQREDLLAENLDRDGVEI
jgi:predicted nucleotidyltransferase